MKYYKYYDDRHALFGNTIYRLKGDVGEFYSGIDWYLASWWKQMPMDELVEIDEEDIILEMI